MKSYVVAAILVDSSLVINPFTALAQEPLDREIISKIRDEGLKRSQVEETSRISRPEKIPFARK